MKTLGIMWLGVVCCVTAVLGQVTQPMVAIHDSELTRALGSMSATADTPTGSGTTNKQWWTTDWHYFVMPESVKEALRSDGTAFTVVGDSNITAGVLLTNGLPKYPIVISLASEAIRNDEIARLTNYVAAGGFLLVGSSAFTRNTNGTTRGDFAFANEMGVHMVVPGLTNWASSSTFNRSTSHLLVTDIPSGNLTWRMPSHSEEISWGISPEHNFAAPHDIWKVSVASGATVVATGYNSGTDYPFLVVKPFGKGYFIYHAAFQPLLGHGGFAPGMYAYMIFRRAIEWAFASANLPIPKLSPWPYPYDAAFMVRHDLENYTNEVARIEASAQAEFNAGAKGDYYFTTGTLRDDVSGATRTSMISSLRRAVTDYNATIGPHNGGLRNPNNTNLARGDYRSWHWGPDEALDVTPAPAGYASGKAYASASISNSFKDVEGWLSGTGNGSGLRTWVACYFNATREDSYDIQSQLGVKITGDQKLSPFPHWTLSTQTAGKRYPCLSEPVSDWFVGGLVAQSMERWHPPGEHTSQTMHDAVDFYYNLGALINIYSHTLSTGDPNDAPPYSGNAYLLVPDYITYSLNTNLHPRVWSANAVGVYQWWLQRSNAQINVTYTTNGSQWTLTTTIKGASHTNTAVEVLLPGTSLSDIQVLTNGAVAGGTSYRTSINPLNGQQVIKLLVGTAVTNAVISYDPNAGTVTSLSENFDSVTAPGLPSGWTTSASGAQSAWVTRTTTSDTPPNAAFATDAANVGDSYLVSPSIALLGGQTRVTFRNNYNLEYDTGNSTNGFDGGVLEIKIGAGAFTDVIDAGGSFVSGGYNRTISILYSNALAGRQAWSGNSGGFVTTTVNLPAAAAGQNIQMRWRCGTDGGTGSTGWYVDTVGITNCACACCWNTPPLLGGQNNQTIGELTTLTVNNLAADADVPAQTLTYTLLGAPSGAGITNGVITWTPTEAQGPGTYTITTWVTDNGSPALSDTNSFRVVVNDVNSVPVLPSQTNRTIIELTLLTVTNTATDSDLPVNTLTYSLLVAPTNAVINTNTGVITWAPTEAQGPTTNTFTTRAVDNGVAPLAATNTFTVVVNESNTPPVLPALGNYAVAPLSTLLVTNTATDPDLPANTLIYTLLVGPTNAAINTNTGVIAWTPTQAQLGTTNLIRTVVTDNNPLAVNAQHLSATNSFTVLVSSGPMIVMDSTALFSEGFLPPNNALDPGEMVTLLIALKNVGGADTTNLVVTLLPTNEVISPSAPQAYGMVPAGGMAISQPFTFTVLGTCGGTITPTLQLQDGSTNYGTATASLTMGRSGTILTQNFDTVTVPVLPSGWTTSGSGAQSGWVTTNSLADTAPNAAYSIDAVNVGVNELVSPPVLLSLGPAQLSFRHRYSFEADSSQPTNGFDGGVLEIKIGTNAFTDITNNGGIWGANGYNRRIDTHYANPLTGRWAWSGTNSSYVTTTVTLPPAAAGQTVQLRWRAGADDGGNSGSGWRIDSIGLTGAVCGFNTAPVLPAQADRTIAELTALTVTNKASDLESPPEGLTYSLTGAPTNASVNANTGVISWTPTEAQGPGSYAFTTVVSDNSSPTASATNTFAVTVNEVNSAPGLTLPADQTIDELAPWSANATATDTDSPTNTMTFELVSGPSGMTVSSGGLIGWTPAENQGPTTNTVSVRVFDDGTPSLSTTNTFTLTVNELNSAPVLTLPANQTIDELVPWSANATATDTDSPPNTLTFELVSGPSGLTVSTTGLINWTPAEDQGPTTNTVSVRVFDDGAPSLSTTNTFTLTVDELNSAPVLTLPANQTIDELVPWSANATGTDTDSPTNTLTFELVSGPSGLTVSTTGLINWTPAEDQGPTTNTVSVRVFDDGAPSLSTTNSFTLTINEVNSAPGLILPADQTIDELTSWSANATATDTDSLTNTLTFELVSGPSGLTVSATGLINWTPAEDQGPTTNTVSVRVFDNGAPSLSTTNSFTLTVNEVNSASGLTLPADQTIDELAPWSANATATDTDSLTNTLTFELVSGPSGLTVSSGGLIGWTPAEDQGPAINTITVRVFDDGAPSLSTTNSFTLTVNEVNSAPVLTLPTNQTIDELVPWSANATGTDTDSPTNTLTFELVTGPDGLTVGSGGLISWTPTEAQGPSTNTVTVRVFDNGVPSLSASNSFVVTVTPVTNAPPPVIQSISASNGIVTITWSAVAGHSYAIERKDDLAGTNWNTVSTAKSAIGSTDTATDTIGEAVQRFYRVVLLP